MVKKNIFCSVCLLVTIFILSSLSFAQVKAKKSGGGVGYFAIGMSMLDLKDLNSRLTAHKYPEFSDNFLSIGGGGHGIKNKLIIGGEGHGLVTGEKSVSLNSKSYTTSLTCGYGLFYMGYLAYSKKALNIYPLLGIGAGGVTLKIAEDSSPSFDQILDAPQRSVELIYGGFIVNLSVAMDYFIKFAETEKGFGGLILGLQAGYMLAPFTHDWKMNENDISGGPDMGFNGPYIRITIGGGGMSK